MQNHIELMPDHALGVRTEVNHVKCLSYRQSRLEKNHSRELKRLRCSYESMLEPFKVYKTTCGGKGGILRKKMK